MIGDTIPRDKAYLATAEALFSSIITSVRVTPKCVIAIAGESGSGKTVAAVYLQDLFSQAGLKAHILHLDDYFWYPPKTNHAKRLENISHVGVSEVNIALMSQHAQAFKSGETEIEKPLVHYYENTIYSEKLFLKDVDILILEGTYSFFTAPIDVRVFMAKNYRDSLEQRLKRNRGDEATDPFNDQVLEIEHQLIAPQRAQATIVVESDYSVNLLQHE